VDELATEVAWSLPFVEEAAWALPPPETAGLIGMLVLAALMLKLVMVLLLIQ
jgi:hypothetical protein